MNIKNLLSNIEKILKEKKISERKACLNADIGPDFIRDMRRHKSFPKIDKLMKLADSLNININYFLNAIDPKFPQHPILFHNSIIPFKTIYIKGNIEASQWSHEIEWPQSEWINFPVPENPYFKNFNSFALNINDDSINLLYPKGSIVIAVNFTDLKRNPENGECVVTIRYDKLTNCYEKTLKIVEIKDNGTILLWSRSNNPNFIEPIILPKTKTTALMDNIESNIVIQSLVIGYYSNSVNKIII